MNDEVQNQILQDLIERSLADPQIPYWVVPLLRVIQTMSEDIADLGQGQEEMDERLVEQQKSLNLTKTQYSELLYYVKSTEK